MSSIFDIPQSASELVSANQGTANAQYHQIPALRDLTNNKFSNGQIQFRFETSGTTWMVPKRSYFRIRCTLTQVRANAGLALPPLASSDIAPSMGLAANLFKTVEIKLSGKSLQRITERLPQIDALNMRMKKPEAFLNGVARVSNFLDYDFDVRRQQVAANGYMVDEKTYQPTYNSGLAAVGLTKVQAHFAADTTVDYPSRLPLAGTITIVAATEALVGVGTAFDVDLQIGSVIISAGGQAVQIKSIASATVATITSSANVGEAGVAYSRLDQDCIQFNQDNILIGEMALRPGDLIIPADGGAPELRILQTKTATTAVVENLSGLKLAAIINSEFTVQKLNDATRNDVTGANSFELIWQPPLGFFDFEYAIPPNGFWNIEFTPENVTDFKKNAIQSLLAELDIVTVPTVANQFDFAVDQMYFYMYTVDHSRFDNGSYFLDFKNVRCQVDNMPNGSTSLTQKNFEVNGKSTALALAFQDQLAGNSTLNALSLLKIRSTIAAPHGQELNLLRFYINYANAQKPSPDFDGKYNEGVDADTIAGDSSVNHINQLVQRYNDTMMQAGCYHAEGACETFQEWLNRGMYFYFNWPKDGFEDNTRVNVNVQFSQQFNDDTTPNMVLFNWWRTAYHITIKDGRVETMTVEEL